MNKSTTNELLKGMLGSIFEEKDKENKNTSNSKFSNLDLVVKSKEFDSLHKIFFYNIKINEDASSENIENLFNFYKNGLKLLIDVLPPNSCLIFNLTHMDFKNSLEVIDVKY